MIFHVFNSSDVILGKGTSNVLAESTLLAMARNINKLHNKIQKGRTGAHLFPLKSAWFLRFQNQVLGHAGWLIFGMYSCQILHDIPCFQFFRCHFCTFGFLKFHSWLALCKIFKIQSGNTYLRRTEQLFQNRPWRHVYADEGGCHGQRAVKTRLQSPFRTVYENGFAWNFPHIKKCIGHFSKDPLGAGRKMNASEADPQRNRQGGCDN